MRIPSDMLGFGNDDTVTSTALLAVETWINAISADRLF
jgi:hypothetical protein